MVLTRPQFKAALEHIVEHIFGKGDTLPLKIVLNTQGIDDMSLLLTLDNASIDDLTWDCKNASTGKIEQGVPVPKGDKNLLDEISRKIIRMSLAPERHTIFENHRFLSGQFCWKTTILVLKTTIYEMFID